MHKFAFCVNLWYNISVFKESKKEGDFLMNESYKFFPMEERQWNQSFLDATKNKDKKKVFELLRQANEVYLDEYYIDHSISELNNSKVSKEKREQVLSGLKNCKIVKDIVDKCMDNAYELDVPLKVDIEIGNNWYEAK